MRAGRIDWLEGFAWVYSLAFWAFTGFKLWLVVSWLGVGMTVVWFGCMAMALILVAVALNGLLREPRRKETKEMKTYVSVEPLRAEDLVREAKWWHSPADDLIWDGRGNQAYVTEMEDGRLQLDVDEDNDVSELRDRFPFERQD